MKPFTPEQYQLIVEQLQSQEEIICLDHDSHIKVVKVAMNLLEHNMDVKAKIIRGY